MSHFDDEYFDRLERRRSDPDYEGPPPRRIQPEPPDEGLSWAWLAKAVVILAFILGLLALGIPLHLY